VSPDPYVRGQALAFAGALLVVSVLGSAFAALACTASAALAVWVLQARYRGDLRAAGVETPPPHRKHLDGIVARDAWAALFVGSVAGALVLILDPQRPDAGIAPVTAVLLGVTAQGVLLSSLVDWYVILPRVSGLLGIRPCRDPDSDFPQRPETWREVTRWWYIHRIVAALVLRFGLSFAISFTVAIHTSVPYGAGIVAGAAVGFLASYLAAVRKASWQAGHPSLIVGRTVRRRDVERVPRTVTLLGRPVRIPGLTRPVVGPLRPREYVYDVALEAVQLAPVDPREHADLPRDRKGRLRYERDPAKLLVKDVDASRPEPAAQPFAGCQERCAGINWYCIDNPRCFALK
jgi:hypothetical protein